MYEPERDEIVGQVVVAAVPYMHHAVMARCVGYSRSRTTGYGFAKLRYRGGRQESIRAIYVLAVVR